jgi:non-ribosomal peptide synthase protein (TIGR01720 family)
VDGYVSDGRLNFIWTYSSAVLRRATVKRLADDFMEQLRSLMMHCLALGVGGFTPSDFPLAQLHQRDLDTLAQLLGKAASRAGRRAVNMTLEGGVR